MVQVNSASLLTAYAVGILYGSVSATQFGTQSTEPTPVVALQVPEIDLDDQFIRNGLSDSMKQSLDLIDKVKTMPSCAKIASSALLHSCSALEGSIEHGGSGSKRGSDLFVEEEADIYAARLAVCELNGARFTIPIECKSFIPTEREAKVRGIRGFWTKRGVSEPTNVYQFYEDITETYLQGCRQALASTPQAWTSYSNSRQNAVVMCRAMRSQIEKDEQIHVSKILSHTAIATTESIQDVLQKVNLFKDQFHELAEAMPSFQQELATGNEKLQATLAQWWSELEQLHDGMGKANHEVDELRQVLHGANDEASNLVSSALTAKSIVSSTSQDVGELSKAVDLVSEAVNYVLEIRMQELTRAAINATQDIGNMNAMMPQLQEQIDALRQASRNAQEELLHHRREQQAYHADAIATLEHVKAQAEDIGKQIFRKVVGGAQTFLRETGAGIALTGLKFAGVTTIFTLLSFGAWERWIGFSFLGNLSGAFASGLVLAGVLTFWPDQFSLPRLGVHDESYYSASQYLLALLCSLAGCALVLLVIRKAYGRAGQEKSIIAPPFEEELLYDPESAPYLDYPQKTYVLRGMQREDEDW